MFAWYIYSAFIFFSHTDKHGIHTYDYQLFICISSKSFRFHSSVIIFTTPCILLINDWLLFLRGGLVGRWKKLNEFHQISKSSNLNFLYLLKVRTFAQLNFWLYCEYIVQNKLTTSQEFSNIWMLSASLHYLCSIS